VRYPYPKGSRARWDGAATHSFTADGRRLHLTVLARSRRSQSNCATSAGVTALQTPRAQSRVYGHRSNMVVGSLHRAHPGALPAVQSPDAVGFPDVCNSLVSCASQTSLLADRRLRRVSLLKTFSMWNRLRPRRCARATRWLSACFSLPQLLMTWYQGDANRFLAGPVLMSLVGSSPVLQGTVLASPDVSPATKTMDLLTSLASFRQVQSDILRVTRTQGWLTSHSGPGQISSMSFCSHHRSLRTARSSCRWPSILTALCGTFLNRFPSFVVIATQNLS